jgi:glycosyltransferase involved in cell wall biosynthesis
VLPNAVNPGPVPPRDFSKDHLQLLFVGRFAFNKGINVLCEAIRQLNLEGYKNKLVFNLVGKGPLYEKYLKEYDFPNINFVGFADDDQLTRLYNENDLFVFPTLFEGMPTVVLEAMAVGMPIIVSDTGATAELVDNGNGYLIEKDNVRSLRWAIQSYYQLNEAQRQALSNKSREKVLNRFTWPKVAEQHIELFEKLRAGL